MSAVGISKSSRYPVNEMGAGYLGGELPQSGFPNGPDGRLRILNEPAIARVLVLSRQTMRPVAETWSRPDGSWRVEGLALHSSYIVIGLDGRMIANAAVQDWVMPAEME